MCISFLLLYNVVIVELLFSNKFPLCVQYCYHDENIYFCKLVEYLIEFLAIITAKWATHLYALRLKILTIKVKIKRTTSL